jgi:hypothetical protein
MNLSGEVEDEGALQGRADGTDNLASSVHTRVVVHSRAVPVVLVGPVHYCLSYGRTADAPVIDWLRHAVDTLLPAEWPGPDPAFPRSQ